MNELDIDCDDDVSGCVTDLLSVFDDVELNKFVKELAEILNAEDFASFLVSLTGDLPGNSVVAGTDFSGSVTFSSGIGVAMTSPSSLS